MEYIPLMQAAQALNTHRTTIERRIKKNIYSAREVESKKQKGKYFTEIAVSSLPVEVQAKLLEKNQIPPAPFVEGGANNSSGTGRLVSRSEGLVSPTDQAAWYQSLNPEHLHLILAKEEIVKTINKALLNCEEKSKTETIKDLATHCGISKDKYYRWNKAYEAEGLYGLRCKSYGTTRSKLTDRQTDIIIAMIYYNPMVRSGPVWKYLTHVYKENPVSGSTVKRWMSAWKKSEHELYKYLVDPDKWRGSYMLSFGDASKKAKHFCHYWEMDSTPADMMLDDGRWNIIGTIDVYSRKIKMVVSPTSKSIGVAECIRAGIIDWGIPETIIRDNGKDYASKHVDLICESLNIETHNATPFCPWEKPHIERVFRTMSTSLFENLKDFIGHNVAERKAIESRNSFAHRFMKKDAVISLRMTSHDLQSVIDDWVENIYHHDIHRGINTTPELKAAESNVPARRVDDERALDILLLPAGNRKIGKKGIRYEGGWYQSQGFVGFVGDTVEVRREHSNAGKIYVFDLQGTYITTAWDSDLDGIPAIDYSAARKEQARELRLRKQLLGELAADVLPKEPIREYIAARKDTNKVKGIPRTRPAELKSLENATDAIEDSSVEQGRTIIDSNQYRKDSIGEKVTELERRTFPDPHKNTTPLFSTMSERYEYLCDEERPLTNSEVEFIEEFYQTDAGKRMLRMDGNILDQKEKEEVQYPAKVALLPLKKATG